MAYSNLSVVISDEAVAAINSAIATIDANLPFLINLPADTKKAMVKMGEGSEPFVEKALNYGKTTKEIVPQYTNLDELSRDLAAAKIMIPIAAELNKLAGSVDDTTTALGSEAMLAALSIYNTAKYATRANVPGIKVIYDDLRSRFPGHSSGDNSDTNTGTNNKQPSK